jgi:hemerythrin-like domain-containing protein
VPTTIPVAPRRPGDPVPNVLGMTLTHRAMLADLRRLAELVGAVRDHEVACTPARRRAICRYVELLCESVRHHQAAEDVMLWPLITASVGDHLDLSELTDDHRALALRLEQVQARAAAFRLWRGSPQVAGVLAVALAELTALLGEHIQDEESAVLAAITDHVSATDWDTMYAAARAGRRMSFDDPREHAVLTPGERATRIRSSGIGRRARLGVLLLWHRRLDRATFGRTHLSR